MAKSDISIKAGALRHLCNILQPVPGPSNVTGPSTAYVLFAGFDISTGVGQAVFAEVSPASARDIIRSGQDVSEVIVPVTIRWMLGVQPNFRIQFLQRVPGISGYTVTSQYVVQGLINTDERNWKMTFACLGLALNT